MQRSCSLFPKKTHSYKPNSLQHKQRRFSLCPKCLIFKMTNSCFSCLPVKESNSLQQLTTPKSTQQKVFHSSFNGICAFIIQSTQNNQRKTLQFQTLVHSHLICSLNLQILTHKCLHCQINIFSMPNRSCFLPSQRYTLYKYCCQKQNTTLLQTICIFLETTSQNNSMQRTIQQQKSTEQTPKNCPIAQSRCCMIRSSCWMLLSLGSFAPRPQRGRASPLKIHRVESAIYPMCINALRVQSTLRSLLLITILVRYSNHFCYWCNQSTSTIPKLNQKAKKQEKFRPHDYQIQSHTFLV